MENYIHVGNKVDKETSENLKDIITAIFKVGHENHIDQETMQEAINMIGKVAEVKQVTISNSVFNGDKTVHMDDVKLKDE